MEQTPDGEILAVERARLEHGDKEAMRALLTHLDPEILVALEATFGWPWVADLMEELGHPGHPGHPPVIRALAKHKAKTDRCDSDRLAAKGRGIAAWPATTCCVGRSSRPCMACNGPKARAAFVCDNSMRD